MKRFLFPLVLLVALALAAATDSRDDFPGRRQGGGSRGSALILVAA